MIANWKIEVATDHSRNEAHARANAISVCDRACVVAGERGIPFEMGLIRSHYVGRTFIEPQESIRHFGVRLKLNPVANIIKGHDGFIRLESQPGLGSRFRIFLPAAESNAPAAVPARSDHIKGGHGENILVIDDERAIQEITKAIFNKHGYRVLTASDGTEAVALFAQHKDDIDLVLTDMVMPFLDGPATISALRRLDPDVRIIAASGLSENEQVVGDMVNTTFLLKPFTTEKLLTTVHQALQPSGLISN